MSTNDPVHPGPDPSPDNTDPVGDDGDGMFGWTEEQRAKWRRDLAGMVVANEASG